MPAVTLSTTYCGATGVTPSEIVRANSISNVTGYRFKIYDATGVHLLKTLDNTYAYFRFNQFNFNYGMTYQVKVQAKQGAMYGPEGAACTVSVQVKANTARNSATDVSRSVDVTASAFNAIAHPNPFTSTFNLTVSSLSDANIEFRVYDMTGKMIENRKSGLSEIQSIELGSYYPSGVYNVIVSQGENTNTVRVIKK
jgi:hypothetical protein